MKIFAPMYSLRQEYISIILEKKITSCFQPIISLKTGEVLGYEALSRGPEGSCFYNPENLFEYAKKVNNIWELDFLCRLTAIEKAKYIAGQKLLFINIHSDIIKDPKFKKGFTKAFLEPYEIEPENIIFEITEHTAITDYQSFRDILDNYRGQGYRIAIDDAGSGYSGLRTMAEIRPNFIKIDMNLIRDIDKDGIKREIIKSFLRFSEIIGIKLIAEGIETYNELKALIEIGIHYGQGYFIQKPEPFFIPIADKLKKMIHECNLIKTKLEESVKFIAIGDIIRLDQPLCCNDTCEKINEIFSEKTTLQGIAVVKENKPVGLIMRNKFYYQMLKQIDKNDFLKYSIETVMDKEPLVAENTMSLLDAGMMAISREDNKIYDYIIVTEQDKYIGVVPLAALLDTLINLNKIKIRL